MIGESACDARIAPIYSKYADVETTILAHLGDIQLSLICTKPTLELAQSRVDALASAIEEELDDVLYSSSGESLERIVLYQLELAGATLATAESCTGGLIAQRLTGISGASRSFLGGAVVYSNELKTLFTGVPAGVIAANGAVSREVASALATGIRAKAGSTFGVGGDRRGRPAWRNGREACRPGLHRGHGRGCKPMLWKNDSRVTATAFVSTPASRRWTWSAGAC